MEYMELRETLFRKLWPGPPSGESACVAQGSREVEAGESGSPGCGSADVGNEGALSPVDSFGLAANSLYESEFLYVFISSSYFALFSLYKVSYLPSRPSPSAFFQAPPQALRRLQPSRRIRVAAWSGAWASKVPRGVASGVSGAHFVFVSASAAFHFSPRSLRVSVFDASGLSRLTCERSRALSDACTCTVGTSCNLVRSAYVLTLGL